MVTIESSEQKLTQFQMMEMEKNEKRDIKEDDDEEALFEDLYENGATEDNFIGKCVLKTRLVIYQLITHPYLNMIVKIMPMVCFIVYFSFAMKYNNPFYFANMRSNASTSYILENYIFSNNKGLALLLITVVMSLMVTWELLKSLICYKLKLIERLPKFKIPKRIERFIPWIVIAVVFSLCVIYLAIDLKDVRNLVSLVGLSVFILLSIFLSETPSHINWRALTVGTLMQFILGVFILRLEFGYRLFRFLGNAVSTFLDFTDAGSRLVFGELYYQHYFAFKALPVIIYFSAIVNILYYFGVVNFVFLKVARITNFLMGTSPIESVNSVANVFLGITEAPVLIKPFLPHVTPSELFAIMTAGFSTIAGTVLAAYISFGIPADHLLTACLMSSPASLAIAKTMFPETKKTKADWKALATMKHERFNNVFEAVSAGAVSMLATVGAIAANLVAFVAIFSFLDSACIWIFSLVNLENFGLSSILEYLFWPFAFLMGVESDDCRSVAKLVGTKIFLNEFVAFSKLGKTIKFRNEIIANGTFDLYRNGTYSVPSDLTMVWNERSIAITTYSICGFANFGAVGIEIAQFLVLAPTRSRVVMKYAAKAMLAGNFSSFMNACIAGLLFKKI